MSAHQRGYTVAAALIPVLLFFGCGGPSRSLHNEVAAEKDRLPQAGRQLADAEKAIESDMAHAPDLFAGTAVATAWPARLSADKKKLFDAETDLRQLDHIGAKDRAAAEHLLQVERALREAVLRDSESITTEANTWLDFRQNIPHYIEVMQHEHDAIHATDLALISKTVAQAQQDWPAKKAALDERLTKLQQISDAVEKDWNATSAARADASAGKATGSQMATLIQTSQSLSTADASLRQGAADLAASSAQLYDSWDKVLVDLDKSRRGFDTVYSEKLRTIHTGKAEASTDERWVDVSPVAYRSVENDLGMTIAHKDLGLFDSEATNTPQPPGFAYIASPSQGSNQYGYWTHTGGHSFWTFLPEYLVMRELFWGHSYRPIAVEEYRGYQTAKNLGRTYYGRETPVSPPRYGSQGTLTAERYAGSRYVQSGGFKGSAYASNHAARPAPSSGFWRSAEPESSRSIGKQFGSRNGGQRFGSRSVGRTVGRSFGRH